MGFAWNRSIKWLFAVCLVLITMVGVSAAAAYEPFIAGEHTLLVQLNGARVEAGRSPLIHDPELTELARQKAMDMAENGYFDHVSPTLGTVYDMYRSAGMDYRWAGENIARASSVDGVHDAFMHSPDHRANILSAGYTHVGVGVIEHRGRVYVAQMFMKPRA